MSNVQLFFSIAGLFSAQTIVLVLYINAKIDPLQKQVHSLIGFMVNHEGRIGKLEGKAQG
jgi:type IV secretory pathway component VirB8